MKMTIRRPHHGIMSVATTEQLIDVQTPFNRANADAVSISAELPLQWISLNQKSSSFAARS